MIKGITAEVYNNKTILSICDEFIHLILLQQHFYLHFYIIIFAFQEWFYFDIKMLFVLFIR